MIANLLLRFGLALVDLDLVARTLAHDILRLHDVDVLDEPGTLRELRRRYAMLAVETGLPIAAQARVAAMAWGYIRAAQSAGTNVVNRREFSFYP